MAKYSKSRIQEIREHLAELTRRGVPVATYAAEIGVSMCTVYNWKKRFGPGRVRLAKLVASQLSQQADLIEIEQAPLAGSIEIVAGGVTVRLPQGCDRSDLEHVLQAVRSC